MKSFDRRLKYALVAYYAVFAFGIAFNAFSYPNFSWDSIGYIAHALRLLNVTDAELHQKTYAEIARAVPPATFQAFIKENDYRKQVYADSVAFFQQLPFYGVRPTYTALIALVSLVGGSITSAMVAISALSVALSTVIFGVIAAQHLRPALALLFPWVCLKFGLLEVAKTTTPDALALLATTILIALALSRRWITLTIALVIATTVRTDLVFFTALFSLAMIAAAKSTPDRSLFLASFIFQCASVALIQKYSQHPGWETLYRFALVEGTAYPLTTFIQLTMAEYLSGLKLGLTYSLHESGLRWFVAMSCLLIAFLIFQGRRLHVIWSAKYAQIAVLFVVLTAAAALIRVFMFPLILDRFYCAAYCTITIGLMLVSSAIGTETTNKD